ncbi:hypothetical protein ACKFKG_32060 [Phormidesmis sp. 146-35]
MSIEQLVTTKLRLLPPKKQQEILDLVEFLEHRLPDKPKLQSVKGLRSNFAVEIIEADIADIRQEMWSNFPRINRILR